MRAWSVTGNVIFPTFTFAIEAHIVMSIKKAISTGLSLVCVMTNSFCLLPGEARSMTNTKSDLKVAKVVNPTGKSQHSKEEKAPLVEKYLLEGQLAAGEKALEMRLIENRAMTRPDLAWASSSFCCLLKV
jgi:hypothetical protein